jgi:hypothetical protein
MSGLWLGFTHKRNGVENFQCFWKLLLTFYFHMLILTQSSWKFSSSIGIKGDFVATVSKKKLNSSLNNIRNDINRGFDEVLERLDSLEASDAQTSIAIRNLEIKTRSLAGETYEDIGRSVGLSKSRVGQIVNS